MGDPYTLRAYTEHTAIFDGWWLVIEDPHVPSDSDVFSIPINGAQANGDVLYPLLGVDWNETKQIVPRQITDRVILEAVEYALHQALSRHEPLSETALGLLNWVSALPQLRTT